MTPTVGAMTRLRDFALYGNANGRGIYIEGPLYSEVMIHDMWFEALSSRAIYVSAAIRGLCYNSTFRNCEKTVDIYGNHDVSWQAGLELGTDRAMVLEDCVFENTAQLYGTGTYCFMSTGHGGRRTVRNSIYRSLVAGQGWSPMIDAHGNQKAVTNNSGLHRGTLQSEIYRCTFETAAGAATMRLADIRGGHFLFWSNVITGEQSFSVQVREEDGTGGYGYTLTEYPGYDPHAVYWWGNTLNGAAFRTTFASFSFPYASDPIFIQEGVNFHFSPPEGYTPLAYPHPWRESGGDPPRGPSVWLSTGTVTINRIGP
jgi:hypothetical protein